MRLFVLGLTSEYMALLLNLKYSLFDCNIPVGVVCMTTMCRNTWQATECK